MINLAHSLSQMMSVDPGYLIKSVDRDSIPHMTVIQFETENEGLLESIWSYAVSAWQECVSEMGVHNPVCTPSRLLSYKTNTEGPFAGQTWVALPFDKAINPLIQSYHEQMLAYFTSIGVDCLNTVAAHYDPHITLFNAPTSQFQDQILNHTIPVFGIKLALGRSNLNWELVSILSS